MTFPRVRRLRCSLIAARRAGGTRRLRNEWDQQKGALNEADRDESTVAVESGAKLIFERDEGAGVTLYADNTHFVINLIEDIYQQKQYY